MSWGHFASLTATEATPEQIRAGSWWGLAGAQPWGWWERWGPRELFVGTEHAHEKHLWGASDVSICPDRAPLSVVGH